MRLIQYKALFLNEARGKLKELEDIFLQLEKQPDSNLRIDQTLGLLHALKGDSATMNFLQLANAVHAVEEFFLALKHGGARLTSSDSDHLFVLVDAFRGDLQHIEENDTEMDLGPSVAFTMRSKQAGPTHDRKDPSATVAESSAADVYAPLGSFVDVPTDSLEETLALANELIASNQQTQRLHKRGDTGGTTLGLFNLATRTSALRQAVIEMKMIPVRQYFVFLARLVRDLARQKKKFITFAFRDNQLRFERHVLDSLKEVCVQLIKNAIDHGFREGDSGTVTLTFSLKNDKIGLQVEDTGHGIDWAVLRKRAIAHGLLSSKAKLSQRKQYELLFIKGVSSRDRATLTSGRGIGLPLVRAAAESLGGRVEVASNPRGTRFDMYVSITPTLFRALTWQWGPYAFALPLFAVEKVIQLPHGPEVAAPKQISYRGTDVRIMDLYGALGIPGAHEAGLTDAVALLSVDGERTAIALPPGCIEQELILQPLASLARFRALSGVAVSEASTPVMIINHRTLSAL
ncbi:MAG: Hpt domain-containing protein [Candidatus Komeilibacteria bacterium]|nr:Hpt domain-containing protein [Candidatus Komeilibacteria bacterium]